MRSKVAKKIAKIKGVPKHTAHEIHNFVCRPTLDKHGNVRLVRVRPRSHREKGKLDVEVELGRLDQESKALVDARIAAEKAKKNARAKTRAAAAKKVKAIASRRKVAAK